MPSKAWALFVFLWRRKENGAREGNWREYDLYEVQKMTLKQPRVPEYRENESTSQFLKVLILFLKDFCQDVWTSYRQIRKMSEGALPSGEAAADAEKLGGKAPEHYIQPRNLLDNSDFTNPVNQRGKAEYAGAVYAIDRWRSWAADSKLIVRSGYISLEGAHFVQYFDRSILTKGKTYTFALCSLDGSISVLSGAYPSASAFSGGGLYMQLTSADNASCYVSTDKEGDYIWAALYEGEYNADNLPPYVSKGYAAELAACRVCRILLNDTKNYMFGGIASSGATAYLAIITPVVMRKVPSLVLNGARLKIRTASGQQALSSAATYSQAGNCVLISSALAAAGNASTPVQGFFEGGNPVLEADF